MQRPLSGLAPALRSLHAPSLYLTLRFIARPMVRVKHYAHCRCSMAFMP
jgi:hypothetical protein